MFKKHALQVTVVKNPNDQTDTVVPIPVMTQEQAEAFVFGVIKGVGITVIAVLAASTVLNVAAELVLRALETNIDE